MRSDNFQLVRVNSLLNVIETKNAILQEFYQC